MATSPTPDRVTVLYDAIDAFQREHRTVGGLQHAQIRALLAEHLDRALPGVAPAADQPAGLRERIAMTLARTKLRPPYLHCLVMADAVLAVLPPPADRAAVLLDAAAECNKAGGAYAERGADGAAGAAFALMETFLRQAGEAEYAATPCTAPNVCEDGGDPCDAHERILGHIEGYHDLCAPDCGQEWQRRLAAEAQQQPEETIRCPLCPDARPLDTPAEARDHFATQHPEQQLVGPGPWPLLGNREQPETEEEEAEPTPEEIVRAHVTTLHLIGEQLANVETWMWEHLADVRAAATHAPPAHIGGNVDDCP